MGTLAIYTLQYALMSWWALNELSPFAVAMESLPAWPKGYSFSVLLEFCMVSLITVFLSFRILYGFSHYGPWQAHAPLYAWMIEPFPFFCANEKNIFNFPRTRSPRNSYPWWLLFTSFDYLIVFTFIFNKKKVHIFSLRKISAF